MNDLEMYREQLALCDDKIIDALVERNSIVEKIMAYKEKYGMTILQPAQEEKQQRRLDEKLAGNKYQDEIEDVFRRILRNSKRIQARKLFPYNIVLIGFMGAGKSAISDFLSTMFDMRLVEMDQEISERQEMSIPDIFATYGEEYFRNLETELLRELRAENGCVISCGGGVALREENVAEMKKNGRVVLLTASPETIYERVKDSNDRPLLNGNKNVEFIADLMEKRREKYEAAADVVIRTDHKTILQSCEELITKLMELDGKIMFEKFFPDEYVASTYVIPFEKLYEEGYRGVIFDIDNTLVPHGAPADERARKLFRRLGDIGFQSCLISNNQKPRVEMFNREIELSTSATPTSLRRKTTSVRWSLWGRTDRSNTVFVGTSFLRMWGSQTGGDPQYPL